MSFFFLLFYLWLFSPNRTVDVDTLEPADNHFSFSEAWIVPFCAIMKAQIECCVSIGLSGRYVWCGVMWFAVVSLWVIEFSLFWCCKRPSWDAAPQGFICRWGRVMAVLGGVKVEWRWVGELPLCNVADEKVERQVRVCVPAFNNPC